MDRLLHEWLAQQLPYTSNCPQKQAQINWKRERLIQKIKALVNENTFQTDQPGEAKEVPNDATLNS